MMFTSLPAEVATALLVLGRILLGGLFVAAAIRHYFRFRPLAGAMAARGVPLPEVALAAGSIFALVAGVALMAGAFVAPAALGLALFTLAASVMMLDFWNKTGAEREQAQSAWLTNAAVVGGLLIAVAGAA